MHNSLNSKKAQFFVLSAFAIVSILFLVSRWLEPLSIIDASTPVLAEEKFIFSNIKEKANQTVRTSMNCNELQFNLQEYKNFVQEYAVFKNLKLNFLYDIVQPCADATLRTNFDIYLQSPSAFLYANFSSSK